MKRLIVLAALALGGCDTHDASTPVTTSGMWLRLVTVEHDGHKFICSQIGASQGGVSMLHHPDCQCVKK